MALKASNFIKYKFEIIIQLFKFVRPGNNSLPETMLTKIYTAILRQ